MNNELVPQAIFYHVFGGGPFKPNPKWLSITTTEEDLKGVSDYVFYDCKQITDWPDDITFYVRGEYPQDFLSLRIHWLIVSDKVKKVFEDCHVDGVQFLPVRIVHEKTHKEYGPYWVWNVYQEVDGLDWEHTWWSSSTTNPREEEYPSLRIERPALNFKTVSNLDVFRLNIKGTGDTSVYISPRVKECMEKASATTGFELKPIKAF